MKYLREQKAEVMTISCDYDTTVVISGDMVEIYASVPTRSVYGMASRYINQGKKVKIHKTKYLPNPSEGWCLVA